MPDYSNYNSMNLAQWVGTTMEPRTGVMVRVASNGTVRARAMQSTTKYDMRVYHGKVTQAQRNAFVDFYNNTRVATFRFTATEDGVQRTMMWAAKPFDLRWQDGTYVLTSYLLET